MIDHQTDDQRFLPSLQVLFQVQKQLWPQLCAVYEKAPPPMPHRFQPGDVVIIKTPKRNLRTWMEGTLHCHPDDTHSCQSGWGLHLDTPRPYETYGPAHRP